MKFLPQLNAAAKNFMDLGGFAPPASPMRTARSTGLSYKPDTGVKTKNYLRTTSGVTPFSSSSLATFMKLISGFTFISGGAPKESWRARAPTILANSNAFIFFKKINLVSFSCPA